jgi:hypothetical protein
VRSQPLVNGTLESPIPDFPKWVISQHVASQNLTVYDCSGVSTIGHPNLSSLEISSSRFSISRNGKSHDTWPLKSDGPDLSRGFHHGKSQYFITRTPEFVIPNFSNWEISRHMASLNQMVQILSRGFHNGKSQSFITRTPEFSTHDFPKWEILRHVASFNWTTQIHFGTFSLIHWGFNPRVSPDRSNDCRVF